MGYRNDHDAALARVDALETELEQMADEYEKTRAALAAEKQIAAPVRSLAGPVTAGLLAVAGIGAALCLAVIRLPHEEPELPSVAPARAAVELPAGSNDLASCLDAIEAGMRMTTAYDERTTDPRASRPSDPASITAFGASCRPELARLAADRSLDQATRGLLARWQMREDELAGAISRIVVYYGSDPYAINGYATAGQLWREFHRAHEARDTLLLAEREPLRSVVSY